MKHKQKPHTSDEWGLYSVADLVTKGKWGIYTRFIMLFIKSAAVSVLVWIRFAIGRKIVSVPSIFWSLTLMSILLLIFGLTDHGIRSVAMLIPFTIGLAILAVLHMLEGSFNLQRRNGVPRQSFDTGNSILWIGLRPLLRWMRLSPKKGEKIRFYQLDQWRWIRFGEPLLVYFIGDYFQSWGYVLFGGYIQIAGICMFIHLQIMVNNYHEMVQTMCDGREIGKGMQEDQGSDHRQEKAGEVVVGNMPKTRKDYENWKQGA